MRKALAAAAVVCSFAFAQSAFAASTVPTISVTHDTMTLNGTKSTTTHVSVPQANAPIAAINIFVPDGYTMNLTQAPGTKIGSVDAQAFSYDAGFTVPLSGDVIADAPSKYTAESTQCAGTPTSQAVWILNLSVVGQTIALPLYVNPTVGTQTALGKYRLTICLPPPDVPPGTPGRSAQGAQLTDAVFTVNGVYTTPVAQGTYAWETLFTPYTPKTGQVNAAGTFEARAIEMLPVTLSVAKTYKAKTNTWGLSGKLTEGGQAVPSVKVHIARGTSKTKLTQKSAAVVGASGAWKTAGHLQPKKTTWFQASASVGERPFGCPSPLPASIAPAGCVSGTLSAWSVKSPLVVVPVTVAKKKHKK